jgi:hydroxymethylpyrimidine pyrophosphatase-like HAD family hydrolase
MIVMYHKFGYEMNGVQKQIDSKMVCIGDDQTYTAMAKTVGLPVAMATLQILNGNIKTLAYNCQSERRYTFQF